MPMKPISRSLASLAGALLLTALIVVPSFWVFSQMKEAARTRQHTFKLILQAESLMADLSNAEAAERGFALTGDSSFLEPYLAVRDRLPGQLAELRGLAKSGASQQQLDAVAPMVEARLAEMTHVIDVRRRLGGRSAATAVSKGKGKPLMDAIRTGLGNFSQIEEATLIQNDATFQARADRLFAVMVGLGLLTLLLALSFLYSSRRRIQQKLRDLVHRETRDLLRTQEYLNGQLRQTNHTLLESQEKLAVTLNSIGDGVIATDAEAKVRLMNPVAEQLTGFTLAQAEGLAIDGVFRIINQETRRPAITPVGETLQQGTTQGLANHTLLIARDGTERAIADSCAPIRGRDGIVIGAVLVFHNVTEEYAAQRALRDSSTLVRTILDTVVDGIITLRAKDGLIETINPSAERMFGYPAAELIGRSFSLLIPELGEGQLYGSMEPFRASVEAQAHGHGREIMGRTRDGRAFTLALAVSDMELGGERYFTCLLRDITLRKQVEADRELLDQALKDKNAELENAIRVADKANLAKSEFLSSMSHELRSPLNAILGFAQLMDSATPPASPTQKASIDRILHAGWYLLELINEILDLAVIESGKLALSTERVALAEVLTDCRSMIEPQAQKRALTMSFPAFEAPLFVQADRTRLKQVLINLLSNAIKYNRPGGTVVVECCISAPGRIRISVRDTGIGLSPEQQRQLFQPFNRLGQEHSGEEGTGIGLVMSKLLVELMGGEIGVASQAGTGSLFWYDLDAASAPGLEESAIGAMSSATALVSSDVPKQTLLYVEDNPANLDLVQHIIARRPHLHLLSAVNALDGIQVAKRQQPAVVLMDINLPGMSGLEALKILGEDPETAHIPVIAISANAMVGDIARGLTAGFLRYLTKPIIVHELLDAIDYAIDLGKTISPKGK